MKLLAIDKQFDWRDDNCAWRKRNTSTLFGCLWTTDRHWRIRWPGRLVDAPTTTERENLDRLEAHRAGVRYYFLSVDLMIDEFSRRLDSPNMWLRKGFSRIQSGIFRISMWRIDEDERLLQVIKWYPKQYVMNMKQGKVPYSLVTIP